MNFPSYEQVQKARAIFSDLSHEHWIYDDFLTWKWWILLFLTIVPWIIWAFLVDKQRTQEILLYGVLTGVFATVLDNIGTELLWWGYPDKLLQMVPPLFPADLTLVPVTMMLIYQYFTPINKFFVANIVYALIVSYIFEPLFIWVGYYELYLWKLHYSFLFYILTALVVRFIVNLTRKKLLRGKINSQTIHE